MEEIEIRYWSHGPHYQFRDSTVFITWRLAGTLPAHTKKLFQQLKAAEADLETIRDLKRIEAENARLFNLYQAYDQELANWQNPVFSLNDEALAEIVTGALHFYAGKKYELHAYCVMSNHIHLLIRALKRENGDFYHIADLIRDLKRYSARMLNKQLGTRGQLWDDYYFDRIIRSEQSYTALVKYILMNPVKAGLVSASELWRDSFYDRGYLWGRV